VAAAGTISRTSITRAPRTAHWLNVVTHLDPSYGGLSSVVPALSANVAALEQHRISIGAFCVPQENFSRDAYANVAIREWPAMRREWMRHRHLRSSFARLVQEADGVHIHGLWEQSTFSAAAAARKYNRPYIVSAHGMLDKWALANRRLKKAIYSALIEKTNVLRARCLHALTRAEAQDYVAYGATQPIAVIPNGVSVPREISPEEFLRQFPDLRGRRLVLFLGRLHFKKGLDLLVDSWGSIAREYPAAHLVLAGPDSEGTQAYIERAIQHASLASRVTFTGMLRGELKWSALAAADCFVLPSYSEGFSVAVLEAMGAGVPVIVSDACNLPAIAQRSAGWVIRPDAGALSIALHECMESSRPALQQMGERGRAFAQEEFSWMSVARRMNDLYGWALGGGPTTGSFEMLPAGRKR
jgi:glycosyltransferase involved in cell wall biosynthesis